MKHMTINRSVGQTQRPVRHGQSTVAVSDRNSTQGTGRRLIRATASMRRAQCITFTRHINSHVSLHYNPSRCQPAKLCHCSRRHVQPFRWGMRGGRVAHHFTLPRIRLFSLGLLYCNDWCKTTRHATASGLFRFHQLMAVALMSN